MDSTNVEADAAGDGDGDTRISGHRTGDEGNGSANNPNDRDVADREPPPPSPTFPPPESTARRPILRRPSTPRLLTLAELAIVVLVAIAVTTDYLDFDPNVVPSGREYPTAIQPYHFWERLRDCGLCALWNGSVRGGYPAVVDVHAGLLHPLPAVTTFLFGVPSGMKLALAGAFVLAGLAQWWLGSVLGLGRIARTWAALLAVMAGNLSGRMEGGWVNVVIATAACALVFAPLLALARSGDRRWAAVLGGTLALAIVAGQGYPQLGLAAILPLSLLLVPRARLAPYLRRLVLAGAIAVLLAAPFLLPFGLFMPEFGKDYDESFRTAQPLASVALNFVIDDSEFYRTSALGKEPFPGLYLNFVGWVPVLLAMGALVAAAGERRRTLRRPVIFLAASVLALVWLGSAQPLRWGIVLSPSTTLDHLLAGVRNASLIAGMAVTPLLGLAAIGADHLLTARWPVASFRRGTAATEADSDVDPAGRSHDEAPLLSFSTRWLLLLPLLLALVQAGRYAAYWISSVPLPHDVARHLDALQTPDLQWVMPPFGEHPYIEPAVGRGMKLVWDLKPWYWRDHDEPAPYRLASRTGESDPELEVVDNIDNVLIYQGPPDRAYATVKSGGRLVVCRATGAGGDVHVLCPENAGGTLTVKEHSAAGWQAEVSGQPWALQPGLWLTLELPPGAGEVRLRYRPWDVPAGLGMALLGVVVAGVAWLRRGRGEDLAEGEREGWN